ncbi:MAG: (d)CMP kinase [Nitrospinae bacterium]|nr:(d)CMP kinase [Nitrospinota bacterium]
MGDTSSEMPKATAQVRGRFGKKDLHITIDGPAGTGKSTLALRLAQYGGWRYIDSGAMYRAAAFCAHEQGTSWTDEPALTRLCTRLVFEFSLKDGQPVVHVNGRDVTHVIRTQLMGEGASHVGTLKGVREVLVRKQQELGRAGGIVMEGRDIGTVVFPDADVKFYLDASPEARGQRRWRELQGRGEGASLAEVVAELRQRDHEDRTREVSPLRVPEAAYYIDTTNLSIDEVFALMVDKIKSFSVSSREPDSGQGKRCLKTTESL